MHWRISSALLRERPDDLEGMGLLGEAYLALGRSRDAAGVLRRGYEKSPDDRRILQNLATALIRSGNEEEGAHVLDQLARLGPERRAAGSGPGNLSVLLLSPAEQRAIYEDNLRRVLATRPTDTGLRARLARLLLAENKTGEAVRCYREILAGPAECPVLLESARALIEFRQQALAAEFLKRAAAMSPSPDQRLDLAIATSRVSGPQAAMEDLEKTPADARKGDYYLVKAQLLDDMGHVQAASESLDRCLALAPARPDLYHSATLFLLRNGLHRAAAGMLERAIKALPDDRELQLLNGVVLALLGRSEESRLLLVQISQKWPEWSRPYLVRGIVEQIEYHSEEAVSSIQTAMALGERGPEAYYYLGLALHQASPEQWKPALDAARQAIEMSPDDPWARILAGRISKQAGQYDAAVRYLKEAIRIRPDLAQGHYWLGSTYLASGKKADGQQEMAEVDRLQEVNPSRVHGEDGGVREKLFALSQ